MSGFNSCSLASLKAIRIVLKHWAILLSLQLALCSDGGTVLGRVNVLVGEVDEKGVLFGKEVCLCVCVRETEREVNNVVLLSSYFNL